MDGRKKQARKATDKCATEPGRETVVEVIRATSGDQSDGSAGNADSGSGKAGEDRKEHGEHLRQYKHDWYIADKLAHPEKYKESYNRRRGRIIDYVRGWKKLNPEKIQEYNRRKLDKEKESRKIVSLVKAKELEENKDEIDRNRKENSKVIKRRYYANNKEKVKIGNRAWRLKNPDKTRAIILRYQHKKKSCPVNDLTADEERFIFDIYGNKCYYCGEKSDLTLDHIQAISKNGIHSMTNIVPACRSCNSKKGNKPPKIPVQPLLKFDCVPFKKG